ncbi:MAG: CalY family protein [Actinomycetota bacterium]|nr:CalY family protein [Actinomycetota bacterium]
MAATGVVVGSGASFTATSANPTNQFTAGSLSMSNSKAPGAILSASGMKPGDTVTGTVDIANTGSLAGDFTLRRSSLTNTDATNPLAPQLTVVVTDCGQWPNSSTPEPCDDGDDSQEISSTLSGMNGTTTLENYAAGEKHTYKFTVTLASGAGDVYQSGGATAEFTWDATQS